MIRGSCRFDSGVKSVWPRGGTDEAEREMRLMNRSLLGHDEFADRAGMKEGGLWSDIDKNSEVKLILPQILMCSLSHLATLTANASPCRTPAQPAPSRHIRPALDT